MDVTITNAGGRIEIVDLRNDLTNNYNVLKDGLRLFNIGDIVRITFINKTNIEINYSEVELINGASSIFPVSGLDFLNELNILLGDFGTGGAGVSELNDLSDVLISAPSNAEVLTYDSATLKWVNLPASGGSGGGDMYKSVYDTDNDGVVDKAETVQIIVRNSTGATLTKGQIVYLSGATGNRPNAVLAQANAESTSSKTIGWVFANISNNSDGYVCVSGSQHDLDTSSLSAGDALWLSPTIAGAITSTIPTQPNHAVFIGYCARSHPTQGRIVFKIQNGYELQELHNVLITSVANNEGLFYESSTSLWKNKTIATALGFTPEDSANKSTSVSTDSSSNIKFPSVKAVYDWAVGAFTTTAAVASQITTALTGYATQSWVNAQGFLTAITSGQITTALGFTPVTNARNIGTTAPLSGGGALTGDLTLSMPAATSSQNGYLSSTDWNTFNNKALNYKSTTDGTATSTNNITLSHSVLIPAGTFTTGNIIRIHNRMRATGIGAAKTQRIYVNSTNDLTGALLIATNTSGSNVLIQGMKRDLVIKSASVTEVFASTVAIASDDSASNTLTNLSIDWTANQYIIFTNQRGSSGDVLLSSSYLIERL